MHLFVVFWRTAFFKDKQRRSRPGDNGSVRELGGVAEGKLGSVCIVGEKNLFPIKKLLY